MDTEVTHEFDRTLATFNGHPHYEIMATGQVYDGDDEVMTYYRTTRTAFPDQRHDNSRFHVTDDAVIVEFDLLGTNLGEFYGLPPTGKAFRVPIIAVFFFEGDRVVNERIYFDSASLVTQIGRGELLALVGQLDSSHERSRRTQEERRTEAEQRLLTAAAELIAEVGPSGVTLANIGERAGYSRGLATHHFGSKGAMMQRLVDSVTSEFREEVFVESTSDTMLDQALGLVRAYFHELAHARPANRARLVLWADAVATAHRTSRTPCWRRIARSATNSPSASNAASPRASSHGSADPRAAAAVIIGMLRGVALQSMLDDELDLDACRIEIEEVLTKRILP